MALFVTVWGLALFVGLILLGVVLTVFDVGPVAGGFIGIGIGVLVTVPAVVYLEAR